MHPLDWVEECKSIGEQVVEKEDEDHKELLSISNCRDSNGKLFWLVHRSDKVTVPPAKPVDIDELNDDLDKLLN